MAPRNLDRRLGDRRPPPGGDLARHSLDAGGAGDEHRATAIETNDDAEREDDATKLAKDDKIRRVVLCSGKVYYDLYDEREKRGLNDVYILRVEQLYPFPLKALAGEMSRFRNAEVVWCQEEPKNMGPWAFVEPYLEWVLGRIDAKHGRPVYVGRPAAASPATGLMREHKAQQEALVDEALTVKKG